MNLANPYERMMTQLIVEAEEGILDDRDEAAIAIFSEGESEKCCEDEDIDDDVQDIEDDDIDDDDEDY